MDPVSVARRLQIGYQSFTTGPRPPARITSTRQFQKTHMRRSQAILIICRSVAHCASSSAMRYASFYATLCASISTALCASTSAACCASFSTAYCASLSTALCALAAALCAPPPLLSLSSAPPFLPMLPLLMPSVPPHLLPAVLSISAVHCASSSAALSAIFIVRY